MHNKIKRILVGDKDLLGVLFKTLAARLVSAFGAIFFSLIIARLAGASELGVYTTLMTISFAIAIIGRFGFDSVFLVHGSFAVSCGNMKEYFFIKQRLFLIMILFSIFAGGALAGSADILSAFFFKNEDRTKEIMYAFPVILIYNAMYFQSACAKCLNKPEISPLIEVGAVSFVAGILLIISKIFGYEITALVCIYCTIISSLAVFIFGKKLTSKYESRIDSKVSLDSKSTAKNFIFEGFDHMLGNLTAYIMQWSSLMILAIYASTEVVGVFSLTQRLAMLTTFILSVFNSISANKFVILSKQPDKSELQKYVRKTTNYMFAIGLLVTLFVLTFSKNILGIFGKDFVAGWLFLIVLNIGQLVNVATGSVGTLLNMTGHQRNMRNIILYTGVSSIVLSLVLIPKIGVWGAVIASFLTLILQNLVASYIAYKYISIKTYPH